MKSNAQKPAALYLQLNTKHVADPLNRHWNVPRCPVELPKLNMAVSGPHISFPVSNLPAAALMHRGTLPVITPKKCHTQLAKVMWLLSFLLKLTQKCSKAQQKGLFYLYPNKKVPC